MRRGDRRRSPRLGFAFAGICCVLLAAFADGTGRVLAAAPGDIQPGEVPGRSGSIAGRVTDMITGAPISGAIVTLDPAPPVPSGSTTDVDGGYRLAGLLPGFYNLRFMGSAGGTRTIDRVRVLPGGETRLDASLPVSDPPDAVRVTVIGDARSLESAGPSEVRVPRGALCSRPASLQDPFRALAGSAGIASQNDFKADLRVRGGEAAETGMLVDGLPLPQPYHFSGGAGSTSTIGSDLVDEVQVRTGGFSVEYGDALAGIVDIVTRDERPDRVTARAGVSTLESHATVAGPAGDGGWSLSGRRSSLGAYQGRVGESGVENVTLHDLMGSLRVPLAAGGRLDLSAILTGDEFVQSIGDDGRATLSNEQRAARARYEVALDERTYLKVLASEGGFEGQGAVDGGASSTARLERQDVRISLQRAAGETHHLNGGLAFGRERGTIGGTVSEGYALLPAAVRGEARTNGLFLEDLWRPSGRFALRFGLRADRFSPTGQASASPRASFEFRGPGGTAIRGAVGRFVQYPSLEQRFLAAGEPLGRQVADHFILGVERASRRGTRLTVEAYLKETRDTAGEAINRYVDLPELMTSFDRGRIRGLDITMERAAAGPWRVRMDYSYSVATQEKDGLVSPRNGDQRHQATGVLGRTLGRGWDLSAMARYASGLPYTAQIPWTNGIDSGLALGPLNSARLPFQARLDIRIARAIARAWGRMEFTLDLMNVTNRRNVRAIDGSFDPETGVFQEQRHGQAPFLPILGLAAAF